MASKIDQFILNQLDRFFDMLKKRKKMFLFMLNNHFLLNNSFFTKYPIVKRIAMAFLVYIGLMIVAIVPVFFISVDWDGIVATILYFGIMGQVCFGGCEPPIILFPFAPVFILTGAIFIIIDLLSRNSIILKYKTRAAFIILGVIVFFLGGIFIVRPFIRRTISEMKSERRLKDAEYYKREYLEIGEPTSSEQFIYARDNRIMVSEMDGTDVSIVKEVALDATKKIFSVSPKGTYYIAMSKNGDEVYDSGIKKDSIPIAEVRAVSDNAFVMSVTSPELRADELERCKWSFDEQFLACRYYRDYVQFTGKPTRKKLALFDIAHTFNAAIIYDEPPTYSAHDEWENFTWSDENMDLFYDQNDKVYRVDNTKEMSKSGFTIQPRRVLLDNLTPCVAAGAYQNNTIYCITTTKELPEYKALPKNEFLSINDGIIIAYRAPEKNESESHIIVIKAPSSFSGNSDVALYPVDANYIAAYGTEYGFFF